MVVGGFITRVTRKIVIGSGRECQPKRGANQRAGEPDGDGGLRYGRKVPEGGAGGNGGDAGAGGWQPGAGGERGSESVCGGNHSQPDDGQRDG